MLFQKRFTGGQSVEGAASQNFPLESVLVAGSRKYRYTDILVFNIHSSINNGYETAKK